MGRRGKAPAPTAVRDARGGPNRSKAIVEPTPDAGEPDRPIGLSDAATAVWRAVVPLLGKGVLTRDNGQTLARYCTDLVRWWKLATWMETNEEVVEVYDGAQLVKTFRHGNVITYEKLTTSLLR